VLPTGKQLVALASLRALLHDVLSGLDGAGRQQPNRIARDLNVLHHQDSVGAGRDGCAGHDLPGMAFREAARREHRRLGMWPARFRNLCFEASDAWQAKPSRVERANGRLVAVGVEGLGKNAAEGERKFDAFDGRRVVGSFDRVRGDNGRGFIVTGQSRAGGSWRDCRRTGNGAHKARKGVQSEEAEKVRALPGGAPFVMRGMRRLLASLAL
jgi:hypothetical protein